MKRKTITLAIAALSLTLYSCGSACDGCKGGGGYGKQRSENIKAQQSVNFKA